MEERLRHYMPIGYNAYKITSEKTTAFICQIAERLLAMFYKAREGLRGREYMD